MERIAIFRRFHPVPHEVRTARVVLDPADRSPAHSTIEDASVVRQIPPTHQPDRPTRSHPGLRWLALATVAATYLLIVVGGLVRASGSGLGCPDWPLCYGQPVPPAQTASVIEYSHRALGAVASTLIALTLVFWARARQWDVRVIAAGAAILLLLAAQVAL